MPGLLVPVINGSPPRAWGAPTRCYGTRSGPRITPTGVGSTGARRSPCPRSPDYPHGRGEHVCSWWPSRSPPDHPHGRGEHANRASERRASVGSPPRAWGALLLFHLDGQLDRITLTGVGSTSRSNRSTGLGPDHPHGRGEHLAQLLRVERHAGSPPRAWGARGRDGRARTQLGITPTGVGSTTRPG